jgi:hypothetical protein
LVEIVPQDEPLHPAPLRLQLTVVFEVPVTLALKSCMPEVGTEALVGVMLNKTATAATIATFAEADVVRSATLVAFSVTVAGEGTLDGAVYNPLVEIIPHAIPVQPAPLTVQISAVFEPPVTFPANCCVCPDVTVALFGLTVIATGVTGAAVTIRVAALLLLLPAGLLTTTINLLALSDIAVTEVV